MSLGRTSHASCAGLAAAWSARVIISTIILILMIHIIFTLIVIVIIRIVLVIVTIVVTIIVIVILVIGFGMRARVRDARLASVKVSAPPLTLGIFQHTL